MSQEGFQGVSRKIEGWFNIVLSGFQCFNGVSRVFKGRLKGVSRKFQLYSKRVSRGFQERLKVVSREFYVCSKGI